jgi:S-adenosylmethionine hydrolase
MQAPIIALLSDFGTSDAYVSAMKAVILGISPEARIIDITHDIDPRNILRGGFVLHTVYRTFPPDTVFLAVVDPGVGTERRGIAINSPHGCFVGPDNGIFTFVLTEFTSQYPFSGEIFTPKQIHLPETFYRSLTG